MREAADCVMRSPEEETVLRSMLKSSKRDRYQAEIRLFYDVKQDTLISNAFFLGHLTRV